MVHYFEEPLTENSPLPCGICSKNINKNHRYIKCNICNYRVHIKCNKTDTSTYERSNKTSEPLFCIKCQEEAIPFQKLTDHQFFATSSKGINEELDSLKISVFPINRLKSFFKEVNNLSVNPREDEEDNLTEINCNYVDINSFDYKVNKKNLSFFHLNIASLTKHKEELEATLKMTDFKFDILGITETKLRNNVEPQIDININGYKTYSTSTEASKGGALIYIDEQLSTKPLKNLDKIMYKSRLLESVFIEICNKNKKNIIVGCIYRHPTMDLHEFNDEYLNPLMEKLSESNKLVYLMGDFNIDLLKLDTDTATSTFFDCITANLFVPHIIHPTRVTSSTKTLIDNIYSNSTQFLQGISGNLTLSVSDHLAQFLIIPEETHKIPKNVKVYKRDSRNLDKENFILDLLSIDWDKVIAVEKNDPNDSFNRFESTINPIIDKYLPLKKLSKKELKSHFKPWITLGLRKSMQRRDKLHKKFLKSKNTETKNEYHIQYKTLRNEIVKLIRESKKLYYQTYFSENISNIKNTWKGIKQVININSKTNNQPSSLIIDNKLITEPKEIAGNFNDYFSSIAEKLQGRIHHAGLDFSKYLTNKNEKNFFIKPTSKFEIISIINNFNCNKAVGPHSIPNEILHLIKEIIADPLSSMVNLSFANGVYFQNLKTSKAIPVYKEKGSIQDCANYRPISLLSNINKIIEKIMHERLYNFLSIHNCIYENQFGFRRNHSTNHALISLTEHIRDALDNNSISCGVFIDLQKAFDTVDHTILLKKLDHYGIRGSANDWFKSYLTNRKQFVSINGYDSREIVMPYGVPQGSVLGPLLFLVYINDLHNAIKYSTVRHFADDTNLLINNKSPKQLQKHMNLDLRSLCKWLKSNKISLNASKTELLICKHPNKKINYDFKIKIDGKKIIPSKYVKYLGVLIDSNLNWSFHINMLSTKLSRAIGMIAKIRHYVSEGTLRSIYFGIFSSLLTYGATVWGQTRNKHFYRVERIQNKAIRLINFATFRASVNPLYRASNILKIADFVKLENFLFVLNDINGHLPAVLSNTFQLVRNSHKYNTRSASHNNVSIPTVHTLIYGIRSIKYQSCQIWNHIMSKYHSSNLHKKSKSVCKRIIRKHFIDSYV